ncbi:MAG: type IV toxin-antitoxin system AbiEi family antitoxin domain-containing protein [Synergistales bacterium]|nr:type IV toxin-antitoxin system AbiEi family antitoxin domain-containing protein [Synergistales bacterium]
MLEEFFAKHPVFTVDELTAFLAQRGPVSNWTRKALLAYHQKQGRILRVRRGLYVVVPPGTNPASCPVDPYLLGAKMAEDAALGYHTALEFHGKAYSATYLVLYLSSRRCSPLRFRSYTFRSVPFPKPLRAKGKELFSVETHERAGLPVRVTSLERTLVDVLDRPDLGGGWEEIWRSLEIVEFFDLDVVVEYTLLLENATTAAKVGFFLEQHRDRLMVEERHLAILRAHRPQSPHYMARTSREPGRLVQEWNLVVPLEILERRWEEVL